MTTKYDVLIVGAGLGGLFSGARLSSLGYKVAVFEQHNRPGGYATNYHRKGPFTFDVSLHGVGGIEDGGTFHQLLINTGVEDSIVPLKKDHPYTVIWNGEKIHIPQDVNEYQTMLIAMFPDEERGIKLMFNEINTFEKTMSFLQNQSIPSWKKALMFPFKIGKYIQWSSKTTKEIIANHVQNEQFIQFFTTLWPYYGLPSEKLSALYFFIPWIGFHLEGTYYIKGGAQALSDSLAEKITKSGGKIVVNTNVNEIIVAKNKAVGLSTTKGDYKANWIISNASPDVTFRKLMKKSRKVDEMLEKIDGLDIGSSLTQLYIGLKVLPSQVGMEDEDIIIVEEMDHLKDYENIQQGKFDAVNIGITNYSAMDASLNKQDKGVLCMTFIDFIDNWPADKEAYEQQKRDVTAMLINRLENYYPGLKNVIEVTELGTPYTMEKYTKNPKGAVYGFAQTVEQAGRNRLANDTTIDHLSLVGAWTQPGGGFQGVATSGVIEANRINKKIRKL
ncbi:phytoene desaturase family protein [Salipaludibacillus sp. HK11]|uniref:phytoene desaturase family protein n=1 Tax=Salipaludibacillus sp. HK11 TaxID=3394320 RepID=UPI0039FD8934